MIGWSGCRELQNVTNKSSSNRHSIIMVGMGITRADSAESNTSMATLCCVGDNQVVKQLTEVYV